MKNKLTNLLNIDYPIIMAPMFLVSNTKMIIEALNSGITGAIPAQNYRTTQELKEAILEIRKVSDKPFGINLIVNKSNPKYKKQLDVLVETKVDFIITSLGSPELVIKKCNTRGIKVFCDVVDLKIAQKVEKLGADAIIAVNNKAGGHTGDLAPETLIPLLKEHCNIPVISAGGVANKEQLDNILALGADGVSVGTIFIATEECDVLPEYKQALVNYTANDIVMTNKMSGSPLSVINTPYVKSINAKTTLFEKLLAKNRRFKKIIKMLILSNGMKAMEKAAFKATYKTVWVAGSSIEYVQKIKSVKQIIESLVK